MGTATQQIIALFGESLFMDMVEACLADGARVGVVRIHPSVPDVAVRLGALRPHAVIVDLKAPHLHFVTAVLRGQPTVPIFCLDVTCNQVVVLTGNSHTIRSVDELLHVVERHTRAVRHNGADALSPPDDSYAVHLKELVDIQTEGKT